MKNIFSIAACLSLLVPVISEARIIGTNPTGSNADVLCVGGRVRANTTVQATEVCVDASGNILETTNAGGNLGTSALTFGNIYATQVTFSPTIINANGAAIGTGVLPSGVGLNVYGHEETSLGSATPNAFTPVLSNCGSGSTVTGTDTAFTLQEYAGNVASGCNIAFGTAYLRTPSCVLMFSSSAGVPTASITTTAITLNAQITTNGNVTGICQGYR